MSEILENRNIEDGKLLSIVSEYDEENKPIRVTDNYIDIVYSSKQTPSRILSNLYPYKFDYFGNQVNSIEAAIQSLKHKEENVRQFCYEYSGIDAVHLRGMKPYDWQSEGILYTPFKPINRFNEEYQDFLDELYASVFQNPLYRNNLKCSEDKMLDHTIGENDTRYTTLTRTEYISRLYALRYCIEHQLFVKKDVMKILTKVRMELN
jgi:Bacteriophage protein GP30.